MNNITSNQEPDTEITLKSFLVKLKLWFQFFFSKRVVLMLCLILGGIVGFTYAYYKKTVYTARTSFVLEEDKSSSGLGSLSGLASLAGVDIGSGGGIFQGDNILELYKSRTMIVKTLLSPVDRDSNMLLIDLYISYNNLNDKWKKNTELKNLNFKSKSTSSRLKDSILGKVVEDINKNYLVVSKPDKKLSIINVEVRAKNEVFAKSFNDQIVQNVNDFYIQTKTKKSLQNIAVLQQKTDSVRATMNKSIYTAVAVADATPNLNLTRQVQRIAPVQRSQFSAETNKAILGELVKNLELSKIALRKETPLIQVIDQPVLPLFEDKASKVKCTLVGMILFFIFAALYLVCERIVKSLNM